MSEIVKFDYESSELRTVVIGGEPWFVLADLCKMLGIANHRNAAARLADDQKDVRSVDTPGGAQQMTIVNESGMYEVVIRSDKPDATTFRRWITSEVLPSIRKTGQYSAQPMSQLDILAEAVTALRDQERRQRELEAKTEKLEAVTSEAALKADKALSALDAITDRIDWYTATGWANLRNVPVSSSYARRLGARASLIGDGWGLKSGTARHEVWGTVNTWPLNVWDTAFDSLENGQESRNG